ncbi:MAG: hypothetical protein GEV08_03950 [Acidimicrobiia bacterium]|nr:hypothetical protein [Acidimicrobiia bacterium]
MRLSPGGHLFRALDEGKDHAPLDLRRPADHAALLELVRSADLVIDNLSPRAAVNLGLTHQALSAVNPAILSLGLPAFPAGSTERDWVAYGTGVHAVVGLGETAGGLRAPAVTYPDPLTGFTAFAAAMALLTAREHGRVGAARAEVPMASAVAPLLGVLPPAAGPLTRADPGLGAQLAAHHRPPIRSCTAGAGPVGTERASRG